jgi:ABC-type glycerol-3-phosphate transport system substrate-binding protein
MSPAPILEDAQIIAQKSLPGNHVLASFQVLASIDDAHTYYNNWLKDFYAGLKRERAKNIGPFFQDRTSFQLNVWFYEEAQEDFKQALGHFRETLHWVKVNVRTFSNEAEYYNALSSAITKNDSPDLVFVKNSWFDSLQTHLVPAPNELFTIDECYDFYYRFTCDGFIDDQKIYGAPLSMKPLVIIVNRLLLNDNRVTVGGMPSSQWFEFLENAKKFRQFSSDRGRFVVFADRNNQLDPDRLIAALLLQAETVSQNRAQNLTDILELLLSINEQTLGNNRNIGTGRTVQDFLSGQVAVLFGTQDLYNRIMREIATNPDITIDRDKISVASIPQIYPDNPVTVSDVWALAVPKRSNYADQAWGLAAFFLEEENMQDYANRPGKIPARKNILYENPFDLAARSAKNYPINTGTVDFISIIDENLNRYLGGQTKLDEMQELLNQFFNTAQ